MMGAGATSRGSGATTIRARAAQRALEGLSACSVTVTGAPAVTSMRAIGPRTGSGTRSMALGSPCMAFGATLGAFNVTAAGGIAAPVDLWVATMARWAASDARIVTTMAPATTCGRSVETFSDPIVRSEAPGVTRTGPIVPRGSPKAGSGRAQVRNRPPTRSEEGGAGREPSPGVRNTAPEGLPGDRDFSHFSPFSAWHKS